MEVEFHGMSAAGTIIADKMLEKYLGGIIMELIFSVLELYGTILVAVWIGIITFSLILLGR